MDTNFPITRSVKKHKIGLRWRFLLYMILLIIVLMGGVFVIVEKNSREVILMEGKKRGISNAQYLAALSTVPLLLYDYPKLEQNVDEVAKEADIVYAIILDKEGSVIAHSSRNELIGRVPEDSLSRNASRSPVLLIQDYRHPDTGEEIWDVAYPILQNDVKWGIVRIGFSKEMLKAEITQNRRSLILLSLAAIILAGAAASLLAARITGPIRKLSDGAISISKGDLSREISIHTGDEIEELSETFNRMTSELSKNRNKQKRLIHQLSQKNRLLKKEIATREKLEGELIKAERLRALGEMSGGVAHDFNNILGTILGRAQLLLEKAIEPRIQSGLKIIEKAALDGAETVRRIQEFTRIRADSSSFIPLDINRIIEDAVEFTRTLWKNEAEAWGIHIDVHCELGSIESIVGDPAGLREVFTNLLINAVDAMPEGGMINITTFHDGNTAVINITDTGIGMSKDVQQRIFEPFFTTKGAQGNGLGLSICYGIISRHQGEINLTSCEGEGTTFTIRLPMHLPGMEEAPPPPEEGSISQARVLIIDDDVELRSVLSDTLAQSGCYVDEAGSGPEGLEIFTDGKYDIVLTDLGMESMSGWEVAKLVKERSPSTSVALITGWGTQLDEKETRRRGVDFIVSKPFRIEKLRKLVNRAMTLKKEIKKR